MSLTENVLGRYPAKWIAFIGVLTTTVGTMTALLLRHRRNRKVSNGEAKEKMKESEARFKRAEDKSELEFLMSQLSICNDDALRTSLLVSIGNDLAREPSLSNVEDEMFVETLRKTCLSPLKYIRKKALFACCNFCRSNHIHMCKSLLNMLAGQVRFLRYIQDFDQLTEVLNCLVNVSLDKDAHELLTPSLEMFGEIISQQGDTPIAPARLAAWKILVNMISNQDMIPIFLTLPWQWLVAIACDEECEFRRLTLLNVLLEYLITKEQNCPDLVRRDLQAVLIAPITNDQLKQRLTSSKTPESLNILAQSLREKLDRIFEIKDGESRMNAALRSLKALRRESRYFAFEEFSEPFYVSPRLCPDPNKGPYAGKEDTFPHHMLEQWDECSIREAALKAVNWYNRMATMCRFPISESMPIALKFVDKDVTDEDFIGLPTRDWTIEFSSKIEDQYKTYMGTSRNYPEVLDTFPISVVTAELKGKQEYNISDCGLALYQMNFILDELAIMCTRAYRELMRLRELLEMDLNDVDPPFKFARILRKSKKRRPTFSLPSARRVNPHRPFFLERDPDDDDYSEGPDDPPRSFGPPKPRTPIASRPFVRPTTPPPPAALNNIPHQEQNCQGPANIDRTRKMSVSEAMVHRAYLHANQMMAFLEENGEDDSSSDSIHDMSEYNDW